MHRQSPQHSQSEPRKFSTKHPKPPKPPPPSLHPSAAPIPAPSALTPKLLTPNINTTPNTPSLERHLPKKSSPEPRVASKATTKAEKAAEKAAEQAALATARASLQKKIAHTTTQLTTKLTTIEATIDKLEQDYIRTTWAHGNVLRGWDGLTRRTDRSEKVPPGNGSGVATGAPKHRKSRLSDRIFSLSSSTSHFKRQNPDILIQKRPPMSKKKKKRP